ncbi:MAG: Hsp70 family protein [Lachnospiraceae bacterium]|nr:Hsp70 family protein [Lachnospiraceae bacterium]
MVLGIDLGTTYSVGAYLDEEGTPQIVKNLDGEEMTPSVVMVDGEDVIVGRTARRNAIIDPENVCARIKVNMGDKKVLLKQNEEDYTPEMLSHFIVKKIVNDAAEILNEEIDEVVITVPAYFSDSQRKATKDAVMLSGLNLIGMIDEPTAAALYYGNATKIEKGTILVYDFGGGTFDATLLSIEGEDIKILKKSGIKEAGGSYFDDNIAEYVMDIIFEKHDIDLRDEEYSDILQELLINAEECKKQLGMRQKASIVVRVGNIREKVEIERSTFEKMISKMYNRTESVVCSVLDQAGLKPEEVDKVLLVGGSSQIPYVQEQLKELFGESVSHEIDPHFSVAKGAAIYGGLCKNKSSMESAFQDVCAHGIGLVMFKLDSSEQYNKILIEANTPIPTSVEYDGATRLANQTAIHLLITEGEFEDIDFVEIISEQDIELPKGLAKNTQVKIRFEIDRWQLLHVYIKIPQIDLNWECDINRLSNLTEEQIREMSGLVATKQVY